MKAKKAVFTVHVRLDGGEHHQDWNKLGHG